MSEKKGFIARLFDKQEDSACCAVRIEEVKDDDATQPPPATR